MDDGSTERLLVGNLLPRHIEGEEISHSGSLQKTPLRSRSPGPPRNELKPSQIQHMLGMWLLRLIIFEYMNTYSSGVTFAIDK